MQETFYKLWWEVGLVGLWQRMMKSKADSKLLSHTEMNFESCHTDDYKISNMAFFTCFDAVLMTQLLLKILSAALLLSRLSQFSVWARGPRCHCSYQCLPQLNSNAAWSTQDQASPTDNLIILVSLPWCPDRPVRPVPCWVLSSPAEPGLPPPLPLKWQNSTPPLRARDGRWHLSQRGEYTGCSQHSGFRIRGLIWVFWSPSRPQAIWVPFSRLLSKNVPIYQPCCKV